MKLSVVAAIGYVKFKTMAREKGSRKIARNIHATLIYPKKHRKKSVVEIERGTPKMSFP